ASSHSLAWCRRTPAPTMAPFACRVRIASIAGKPRDRPREPPREPPRVTTIAAQPRSSVDGGGVLLCLSRPGPAASTATRQTGQESWRPERTPTLATMVAASHASSRVPWPSGGLDRFAASSPRTNVSRTSAALLGAYSSAPRGSPRLDDPHAFRRAGGEPDACTATAVEPRPGSGESRTRVGLTAQDVR